MHFPLMKTYAQEDALMWADLHVLLISLRVVRCGFEHWGRFVGPALYAIQVRVNSRFVKSRLFP